MLSWTLASFPLEKPSRSMVLVDRGFTDHGSDTGKKEVKDYYPFTGTGKSVQKGNSPNNCLPFFLDRLRRTAIRESW